MAACLSSVQVIAPPVFIRPCCLGVMKKLQEGVRGPGVDISYHSPSGTKKGLSCSAVHYKGGFLVLVSSLFLSDSGVGNSGMMGNCVLCYLN